MSKLKEMEIIITELRRTADNINNAADSLSELFSSPTAEGSQVADNKPAADEPELTLETVRAVLSSKSADGFAKDIRALILKYGADRLSEVDHTRYKELLADVEELEHAG